MSWTDNKHVLKMLPHVNTETVHRPLAGCHGTPGVLWPPFENHCYIAHCKQQTNIKSITEWKSANEPNSWRVQRFWFLNWKEAFTGGRMQPEHTQYVQVIGWGESQTLLLNRKIPYHCSDVSPRGPSGDWKLSSGCKVYSAVVSETTSDNLRIMLKQCSSSTWN